MAGGLVDPTTPPRPGLAVNGLSRLAPLWFFPREIGPPRRLEILRTEVVTQLEGLEGYAPGWDALAVASRRPRSAPAWSLAWYRHALPVGAMIRVVIVTEGDAVVAVAPFFVVRTSFGFFRYDQAAPQLHGVEPICAVGRDEEAGEAIASALATCDPTPDIVSLDWIPAGSPLPQLVCSAWPRPRPTIVEDHAFPAPRVELAGRDFEKWLEERSRHFRKLFRSSLRKLRAEGFEHLVLTATPDILERLPEQQRLYEGRRAARDGAGPAFDEHFMAMVSEAVARSETGRVRLATLERPGEVIAAHLAISGGGESSVWIGGFEEHWASLSPGRVNLALCVEDSMCVGDTVMDLGPGDETYKYWLTDDEVMLQSCLVSRRGLRPFHTPAQLLPFGTRQAVARLVGRFTKSA